MKKIIVLLEILLMTYALTPGNLKVLSGELDGMKGELLFFAAGMGVILWLGRESNLKKNRWIWLLCAFLSFTTVQGRSYQELGSWDYLFGSVGQFFIALLVMSGYFLLYLHLIALGEYVVKHFADIRRTEPCGKLEKLLFEEQPFWGSFIFAMIFALPYVISFYPGVVQADAFEQLYNYMGIIEFSNHHPVVSTKIMGACLALGREVFGSDNIGFYIYNCTQSILQWAGIAYLLCVMKKMKTPIWIRWGSLLFLTVLPLYPRWGYTIVKDAQYYICLLYFMVSFADILLDGTQGRKHWKQIVFCIAVYGMVLCRKEGRYVVALTLICYFLYHRKQWKLYLFAGLTGFLMLFLVEQVYIPSHGIMEGRIAEALSIPAQQTTRYAYEHRGEVTEEEYSVLSEFFDDYDALGPGYYGEVADGAKARIIDNPTKEQLQAYFKVWFEQFCKHPDTYVQAFLNQTYGYFYINRYEPIGYVVISTLLGHDEFTMDVHHMDVSFLPQLKGIRKVLDDFTVLTTKLPLVSLLYSVGFHGYLLISCVICLCAQKRKKEILFMVPVLLAFLVCLLSPVNGEIRYMLPIMLMLPLDVAWCARVPERKNVE